MNKVVFLLLYVFAVSLHAQDLNAPKVYSDIHDLGYDFNDHGFIYTVQNLMPILGVSQQHKSIYGAIMLENGSDIFKNELENEDTSAQSFSSTQVLQQFDDGSNAMVIFGNEQDGHYLYDSEMNIVINLFDLNVFPEEHGIAKLSDGRIVYLEDSYDSINFFNPPLIMDSNTHLALGHNINILDLQDTSVTEIFNWHDQLESTMVIPEYLYEGDQGPNVIDWGHPNWIHTDYDGNIIVSWRHLGICKIDMINGGVIWWAGVPQGLATENGFNELTCLTGDCRTRAQHNFKPITGMNGYYTVFDNGDSQRDSSRALFLKVNEDNNTIEVDSEYWFDTSPFMGSVDRLPTGDFLVNVPTLGGLSFQSIALWQQQGVLIDSIGPFLLNVGSHLYFLEEDGSLISEYWTDSFNFIYSAQLVDYGDWPSLNCDEDNVIISEPVINPMWSNGSQGSEIQANGDIVGVSFEFGTTIGYTQLFDSGSCLSTHSSNNSQISRIVYPNPTNDFIVLDDYIGMVMITDVNGRNVLSGYSLNGVIDVKELTPGFYFVLGTSLSTSFIKN